MTTDKESQNLPKESVVQWPDCGQVQCAQVHNTLDSLLQWLEADCPRDIVIVGKMVRVMDAIKAREAKARKPTTKEFVEWYETLNFEQHCLLAAQSLLRAASLVK